jgi:potassium voltage-gated channel Eag-related subfamily H protein 5
MKMIIDKFIYYYRLKIFSFRYLIVFKLDSTFKLFWDIWQLFVLLINVFYFPMRLSFDLETNDSVILDVLFHILPLITFILELLINFNLQVYKEGRIHKEREIIVKNYIKGNFTVDFLVVIPFFIK